MLDFVTDYTSFVDKNLQTFKRLISEGRKKTFLYDIKFSDARWGNRFVRDLQAIGYKVEMSTCKNCNQKFDFIIYF